MRLGSNVPRDYFVAFFSHSKSARRKTFQPRTDWVIIGFPEPGDYRIFVQVKRRGRVATGVFDTQVE
jgi:hypothetical protein